MLLTRDSPDEANAIVACAQGEIRLRTRRFTSSVIVTRNAVLDPWRPPPVAALTVADFGSLLDLRLEILLLGTGMRQQLPPPELFPALAAHGIGLEVMDNHAACRTYNLLLSESREVAVALIL